MRTFTDRELAEALRTVVPEPEDQPGRPDQVRRRARRIRTRRRAVLATSIAAVALAVGVPAALTSLGGGPVARTPQDPAGPGPVTSAEPRPCADHACDPQAVLETLRRPLDLPEVAPGAECPVSPVRRFPGGAGFTGEFAALGPGPVYLAGAQSRGTVPLQGDDQAGGPWLAQKVIWVFDKSYSGPVLLRGDRIDGRGALGFVHYIGAAGYSGSGAGDDEPHRHVLYVRGGLASTGPATLSSYPGGVFAKGPGCYAVQVDGVGFSETLVFQATAP